MHIEERVKALAAAAKSDERRKDIQTALKRLVDPQGMGTQYQFMGIVSKNATAREVLPHPFGEADR
jgi:SAM-dependent MidA family methyltransferase